MDRLFSTYITPQIKEIYHPAIIQEWKLNIYAAEYEKNMTLTHLLSPISSDTDGGRKTVSGIL